MNQELLRINRKLANIEMLLGCICHKLDRIEAEDTAILSLLAKIIKDIEGAQTGIDTANTGIDTANGGISLLSLDVGTANDGITAANDAIANINCSCECDLTEVIKKLNKIITEIPKMKCRFPGGPKTETK